MQMHHHPTQPLTTHVLSQLISGGLHVTVSATQVEFEQVNPGSHSKLQPPQWKLSPFVFCRCCTQARRNTPSALFRAGQDLKQDPKQQPATPGATSRRKCRCLYNTHKCVSTAVTSQQTHNADKWADGGAGAVAECQAVCTLALAILAGGPAGRTPGRW